MHVSPVLHRLRDYIKSFPRSVDGGGPGDPYLRRDVGLGDCGTLRHGDAFRGIDKASLPDGRCALAVSIKRVDAVVLGGDEDYVARSAARNAEVRNIERLRVDLAIYVARE